MKIDNACYRARIFGFQMTGERNNRIFPLSCFIALSLLASISLSAVAGEQPLSTKGPIIFDAMKFRWKPDLGLSQQLSFTYESEAALRDEGEGLALVGSNKKPLARTVEPHYFNSAAQLCAGFKYIVMDIESLHPNEDPIAIHYVELGKAAAPNSKVAKWNADPRYVAKPRLRPFDQKPWQAEFGKRKALVEANDFCILGSYFKPEDTIEAWQARHVPRIAEARRLYGAKPILVTLAPHSLDKGRPWPFVGGKLLGEAMDGLVDQQIDGIVLLSFEGTGQLQSWVKNWDWVRALRARMEPGGGYMTPVQRHP